MLGSFILICCKERIMRRIGLVTVLICCFVMAVPDRLLAQSTTSLAQILPSLITQETVINAQGSLPGIGHTAHFIPDFTQQQTPALVNGSLISQLPTFPLGSSSGGFTYTFDPALGVPRRSSSTFGPAFAERPLTNGRRQLSVGFTYQHTSYDQLEGQSLNNGNVKFYVKHNDCCPGQDPVTGVRPGPESPEVPAFEADLIEEDLTVHVKRDIGAFFASYGITDRLDVGIAIPVLRVALDATVDSTLLRLGTASDPTIHRFATGDGTHLSQTASGSSTGIGDVLLRGKYLLLPAAGGGLGVGIDLRLPTGDETNLRGTGGTQTKLYVVAAGGTDRVAPHVNLGYTLSSSGSSSQPDELNYVGGVDFAASRPLTIAFDVVGRTLRNAGRLQLTDTVFNPNPPIGVTSVTLSQFSLQPDANLTLVLGAVGVKYNLTKTLLLTANVLFPMTAAGLRPGVTPVIGFDDAIQP
jgi:Putative MetA-pathway of phenol degradation